MKVIISQSDLLESLKTVARAVSTSNTLPVLGNILIKTEGKKVYFAATNLEISISTSVEADVQNEGSFTVPSKILTSYTSLLNKNEDIELRLVDGNTLAVTSETSKTKIKGISADEFPDITRVDHGTKISLPADTFKEMVHQVAFSAQENASRPILAGVFFNTKNQELRVAATDTYRLSEKIITLEEKTESLKCIIPVRALFEADRLLAGKDSIDIIISENQAMFSIDGRELISRLIEGQFPPYEQIIPKGHKTRIEVNKDELALAVRRVSIFAKENNQHMKLECLNDGILTLSTDETQIGQEKTKISVKIEGENNVIALNTDYVLDILNAIPDEIVIIEMSGKITPAIFRRPKKDDFLHLVMPLKV